MMGVLRTIKCFFVLLCDILLPVYCITLYLCSIGKCGEILSKPYTTSYVCTLMAIVQFLLHVLEAACHVTFKIESAFSFRYWWYAFSRPCLVFFDEIIVSDLSVNQCSRWIRCLQTIHYRS